MRNIYDFSMNDIIKVNIKYDKIKVCVNIIKVGNSLLSSR